MKSRSFPSAVSPDAKPSGVNPKLHLWPTHIPYTYTALAFDEDNMPSDDTVSSDTVSILETPDAVVNNNIVKLKGAIWPGMGAFDSATDEMRRMRNQKKHFSVVEKLERNSLRVQPIEVISDGLDVFVKSRIIDGKPDLESPISTPSLGSPDFQGTYTLQRPPLQSTDLNSYLTQLDDCKPTKTNSSQSRIPRSKRKRDLPIFHDGQCDEQLNASSSVLASPFDLSLASDVDVKSKAPHSLSAKQADSRQLYAAYNAQNMFDPSLQASEPPVMTPQYCVPGQYNHGVIKPPTAPDFWSTWGGYDLPQFLTQHSADGPAHGTFEPCTSPRDSLMEASNSSGVGLGLFSEPVMTEQTFPVNDEPFLNPGRQ